MPIKPQEPACDRGHPRLDSKSIPGMVLTMHCRIAQPRRFNTTKLGFSVVLITTLTLAACGTQDTSSSEQGENPVLPTSGNDAPNGSVNDSSDESTNAQPQLPCASDSFDLSHGGALFRFEYVYDTANRRITTETTRVSDGNQWLSENTVYRADGRASETWEFSDTDVLLSRYESTYTAQGALKTKNNYDSDNNPTTVETLTYNGLDQLIEHRTDFVQIEGGSRVTYAYDDRGRLIETVSEGFMTTTTTYAYNDEDRLIQYEVSSQNASTVYDIQYEVDAESRVLETEVTEVGNLVSRTTYKYTGDLLVAMEVFNATETLVSRTYYFCDSLPSL